MIAFEIPDSSHVTLVVYNVLGQVVDTLLDKPLPPGEHELYWDATDSDGKAVDSGIYFYKLEAGEFSDTKKMVLLK